MDVLMGIHVPSNVPMEYTPFKGMEFEADEIAYCKVEFIQSCVGFILCQICLYFSN